MKFADLEPLIPDARLERLEEKFRRAFVLPEGTVFVTYIEPKTTIPTEAGPTELPERATFAVISPNPRHPTHSVMTKGATWLSTWRHEDSLRRTFAGVRDLADEIYRPIIRRHLETIKNLREMH